MQPVSSPLLAHGANAVDLKFYVTDNGEPVPNVNVKYRVLPEEWGQVKSNNEITDEHGLDWVTYYQIKPVIEPSQEVIIEATLGRYVKEFTLALLPYDPTGGEELTLFTNLSKERLEQAESEIKLGAVDYDMTEYYDCLMHMGVAEAILDYTENIADVEKEAKLRREIARYRELVRLAAYPKEDEPAPALVEAIGELEGIYFENGKWAILPRFQQILQTAAEELENHPDVRIRIAGHTDDKPIPMGNYLLSVKRSQAVKNYLVENFGIDPERFTIQGFGPDQPIADNDTAEGRAQNRRIEFEILQ